MKKSEMHFSSLLRRSRREFLHGGLSFAAISYLLGVRVVASSDHLAAQRLQEAATKRSVVRLPAGRFFVEGKLPIQVKTGSLILIGQGSNRTVFDLGDAESDQLIYLSPGTTLQIQGIGFQNAGIITTIEVKAFKGKPSDRLIQELPIVQMVSLTDCEFSSVKSPFSITNGGFKRQAIAGVERVNINRVSVNSARRGFMLGDLGHFIFRHVSVQNVHLEDVGRFGLFVGSTEELSAKQTKSIFVENVTVNRLRYEPGKNCAHLVLVGRNVRARNLTLTGTIVKSPSVLEESNKEALYLKCFDALIENVKIEDVLADQGAVVLKGESEKKDSRSARGGNYLLRNIEISQTSAAVSPMRGFWIQTTPTVIEDCVARGLSKPALIANAKSIVKLSVSRLNLVDHRSKQGVRIVSPEVHDVLLDGLKISAPKVKQITGVVLGGKKGRASIEGVRLVDCIFELGHNLPKNENAPNIGLTLKGGAATRIIDVEILRCTFDCDAALEIVDRGVSEVTFKDCDFSKIAAQQLILFRPSLSGSENTAHTVRFAGGNIGLDLSIKQTFDLKEGEMEMQLRISHPLLQNAGWKPALRNVSISNPMVEVVSSKEFGWVVRRRKDAPSHHTLRGKVKGIIEAIVIR